MKQLLLAILLAVVVLPVQAQPAGDTEEVPNWYRVELLVFANRDPQTAVSETWPLLPELAYPAVLQRIHSSPHRVSAQREFELLHFDSDSLLPQANFDLAWDSTTEQLLYDYQQSLVLRQPDIQIEPLFDLDIPSPFAQLPAADAEFNSQRKRLDRSRDIDVLVHQSWLQPMRNRDDSTPLQIDTTALHGDFPELQGSILLYSARYLHLETNLWLNTDGSYLATPWSMPLPPLPPPAADQPVIMSPFEVAPSPQWLDLPDDTVQTIPTDLELESELETEPPPLMSEEMLQAFLDKPDYRYRHAVLMQQRRRMRGGEIHFIDHPMFGVIIKVTRYEFQPFVQEADGTMSGAADRR